MENKPILSVIMPAYNVEKYIRQCLESLVNQTEENIEIVCVDDCSSDKTAELIEQYCRSDHRVRLIRHASNLNGSQARKDGILASSGEYIMFADADDYLETNACETAVSYIRQYDTDVLQFGTFVENCAALPEERILSNQRALEPCTEKLEGDVFGACFLEKKFSFTLWNKIYRGSLCRKAAQAVADGVFPKANDLYLAYYILYYAGSYAGVADQLYHYCFGRGMTGHNLLDLDAFDRCCQSWRVYEKLAEFGDPLQKGSTGEVLEVLYRQLFNEQLGNLLRHVSPEDQTDALRILQKAKGDTDIELTKDLALCGWDERGQIAAILERDPGFRYTPRPVRTIALYYRSIRNGGAQRTVANISNMLAEEGASRFRIVLVTEEEPQEEEYGTDERIIRAVIPSCQDHIREKYAERAEALYDIIENYQVDVFIDSMWVITSFFWDMMSVRSHPSHPAVVVHTHSASGVLWSFQGRIVEESRHSYAMADAVVVLSKTDRAYWSTINRNVFYIPNSLGAEYSDLEEHAESDTILWVGRISPEKQPLDIVRIMHEVVKEKPDARCLVVGSGDEELSRQLQYEIALSGLEENILLEGFQTDLSEYYKNAGVLLFTSKYEGYPLTLYEAAAYGLPIVMYEIPWIEFNDMIDGYETVPQNYCRAAAGKILQLLKDQKEWEDRSKRIRESYHQTAPVDTRRSWLAVLDSLEKGSTASPALREDVLLNELMYFHADGIDTLLTKLHQTYREKSEINAKLQITYAEKAERGIQIKELKKERSALRKELNQAYRPKRMAKHLLDHFSRGRKKTEDS